MSKRPVNDAEANATTVASRELIDPLKLATHVFELATMLQMNNVTEEQPSGINLVRLLLLLQRIQNDLRCCVILVEHGYALQAAALAAGIYEAWVTIANANIKTDEDARKWLSHAKKNESYGDTYSLTERALMDRARLVGGDLKEVKKYVKKYYSLYQQLCMAKHLNPMVERNRGYDFDPDGKFVQFCPGPDTSEREIAMGWFALETASRFAALGLSMIAVGQETSDQILREFETSQVALNALVEEGMRRFPNYLATNG